MESSQSQKHIRPLSARKINPIKTSARKKTGKTGESSKLLRRISPKINSPSAFESSSVRNNAGSGRTLSSEFTLTPTEINKALTRLEREHNDLLALYNKLCDDLLHLKTLEKLDNQREKQIAQTKAKLASNSKEKNDILANLKICEVIFKDFGKKMEKGGLSAEEKKSLANQIQAFYLQTGIRSSLESEASTKEYQIADLWDLIPKTEKLLKKISHR